MMRTREIIKNFSYDELVNKKVIPDLVSFMVKDTKKVEQIKKYPPFVYKCKDYSYFGIIMEYIVRAGLRINLDQEFDFGIDPLLEAIESSVNLDSLLEFFEKYNTSKNLNIVVDSVISIFKNLNRNFSYDYSMFKNYIPTLVNIIKDLVHIWKDYIEDVTIGTIRYNTEYTDGKFSGHPDLMTENSIFDVKTSSSFMKMSKESCLQILAYYALIKPTNKNIKYIGFILPMQREIVVFSVEKWNYTNFLGLIHDFTNKTYKHIPNNYPDISSDNVSIMDIESNYTMLLNYMMQQIMSGMLNIKDNNIIDEYKIGYTIKKDSNMKSLISFAKKFSDRPCQMFLRNPTTGKIGKNHNQSIEKIRKIIKDYNLNYFTHAAYIINMCSDSCDEDGDKWQQRILNEDIISTVEMGGMGVVVHTGSATKKNDPFATMEDMVRTALKYCTKSCPLLLETPCGEGKEICDTLQELGEFFNRFTKEERKKLGLCADTCHIFASGADPLEYLIEWDKKYKVGIKLVHFNDSMKKFGCRVDRHAPVGMGHIGYQKMSQIADWCYNKKIPMLVE